MKKKLRLLTPLTSSIIVLLLTLCGSQAARGLGLGDIQAESALNEPLVAKIKLLNASTLSNRDLIVAIGSKEDYRIAGVERDYFHTDLTLKAYIEGQGTPYIGITSTKPVLEPFVNFVAQIRWPQGKLLREYTILLDLPVFTDRSQQQLEAPNTALKFGLQRDDERSPRSSTLPLPPKKSVKTSAATANVGGEYLVKNGDTLWRMAGGIASDTGTTRQQAMLAIREGNPNAFVNGNPNALKSGVVLRMPDQHQVGRRSASDAAVEFSNLQKRSARVPEATPVRSSSHNFREQQSGSTPSAGRLVLTSSAALGVDSQATEAESSAIGGLANENAVLKEELDRVRVANNDLRERLSALEEQLEVQSEIVALLVVEDNELAATQESLAAASALANEPAVTTADETSNEQTQIEQMVQEQTAAETAAGATAPEAEPAVHAETVQAESVAEASLAESLMGFLPYNIGAGLVVLLLVVMMILKRRKASTDKDDDLLSDDLDSAMYYAEDDKESELEQGDETEPDDITTFVADDDSADDFEEAMESMDELSASDDDEFGSDEAVDKESSTQVPSSEVDGTDEGVDESDAEDVEDNDLEAALEDLNKFADLDAFSATVIASAEDIEAEGSEEIQSDRGDHSNEMGFESFELPEVEEETAATDDDLSGLDLDLGDSDEDDVSDLTGGLEDDMDKLLADFGDDVKDLEEEISTKLELAEAYVEVVDIRGAKDLLNEILADGNDAQKEAAQKLSERIKGLG